MKTNHLKRKSKGDEVLNHNIAVAPNFSFSPTEFYDLVEKELATRKIPSLSISRVDYAEGGILSDKRTYLRVIRERFAFDTCASPFGSEYFFSYRSIYSPPRVKLWHVLLVIALCCTIYLLLVRPLGFTFAGIAVLSLLIATAQVFQNAVAANLADLDTFLLKIPALGPIYETWFRKETYYRYDTRLVYLEIIPRLVQGILDEITAQKGVKLVNQYELSPVLGDLYKRRKSS